MKKLIYLFALILFALTSCTPEDGIDGIDGKDGIAGVDGIDGIDGQDGIDGIDGQDGQDGIDGQAGVNGLDGNANVFATGWSYFHSWTTYGDGYAAYFKVPEITAEIRATGIVLVYYRYWKDVYILPMEIWGGTMSFNLINDGEQTLRITLMNSTTTPDNSGYFRVVIIESPGFNASKTINTKEDICAQLNNTGVDINNYDEVMSYFRKQ